MKLQMGKYYQVSGGSGLASGKIGKLVKGIKRRNGSYENRLIQDDGWVDILTDDGERICMTPKRLEKVNG